VKSDVLPISAAVIKTVRNLRKAQGISAKELARLMGECGYGTSRTSVAQAECGYRKEVSIDWVSAASQALGVSIKTVLYGPDCTVCNDNPPAGFTCNSCGTENI
jgi:transcriptional regulator with XRE-family HTH domain